MDGDDVIRLEKKIDSTARLVSLQMVALLAVLKALTKQDGIDRKKLTEDINHALLVHEISSEAKPDGVSAATPSDYVLLRHALRNALEGLPVPRG